MKKIECNVKKVSSYFFHISNKSSPKESVTENRISFLLRLEVHLMSIFW